jgi:acylphosphatase
MIAIDINLDSILDSILTYEASTLTCHLQITGDLQGVGYRWSMAQLARSLGLSGWVQKQISGHVQATISGPADSVQALITWATHGPTGARVQSLVVTPAQGVFNGFEQRETGWNLYL